MEQNLIEDKLHQIIDKFNERNITRTQFYSILLNEIHPLYDGNGRTYKMLFADDDKNDLYSDCIDCSFKKVSVMVEPIKYCLFDDDKNNLYSNYIDCSFKKVSVIY